MRLRKALRRALSAKAVSAQENILQFHATELVDAISRELAGTRKSVDMGKWFSLVAFDVISDLAFGHSFENVKSGALHRWAAVVFGAFIALPWLRVLREIPGVISIGHYATYLLPRQIKQMFYDHFNYAFNLIDERLKRKDTERMDWLHYLADKVNDDTMTMDECKSSPLHRHFLGLALACEDTEMSSGKENMSQLTMAGSEPVSILQYCLRVSC
jgi:cytochrome P450